MAENLPTAVLDASEGMSDLGSATSIIGLELNILGKTLNFRIGIAKRQARLADIVPVARTVCSKITDAAVESISRQGGSISCRKGCSACCSHYLVPLSIPEALRMREEVLAMPANRRVVVFQSCLDAAKRILDDTPESFDLYSSTTAYTATQVSQLGRWYAALKLPCPFLSHGLCTIYEQRPTACREHIVTSSALLCETEHTDESQPVRMPVSVLEALGQLASDLEGTPIEAIMLPLALPWARENLERNQQTWPAVMMVERFVEIIKAMAAENSVAAVG